MTACNTGKSPLATLLFPLSPNECVFFDMLGRYFPDWREVAEGTSPQACEPVATGEEHPPGVAVPSVTSQQLSMDAA